MWWFIKTSMTQLLIKFAWRHQTMNAILSDKLILDPFLKHLFNLYKFKSWIKNQKGLWNSLCEAYSEKLCHAFKMIEFIHFLTFGTLLHHYYVTTISESVFTFSFICLTVNCHKWSNYLLTINWKISFLLGPSH